MRTDPTTPRPQPPQPPPLPPPLPSSATPSSLDVRLPPTPPGLIPSQPDATSRPAYRVDQPAIVPATSDARLLSVRHRRRRSTSIVLVLVVLALVVAVSVAVRSAHRADDSETLARHRLEKLSTTARELATTRSRLHEAVATRDSLEQRISQLTNDKAQIQDQRNAAQELARLGAQAAQQMLECRDQILDAMESMAADLYATASAQLDTAVSLCQSANSAVAQFSDAAG